MPPTSCLPRYKVHHLAANQEDARNKEKQLEQEKLSHEQQLKRLEEKHEEQVKSAHQKLREREKAMEEQLKKELFLNEHRQFIKVTCVYIHFIPNMLAEGVFVISGVGRQGGDPHKTEEARAKR